MPKPRVLGYIAQGIVNLSANQLALSRQAVIDLLILNHHGDKDGVAAMVKIIIDNDLLVIDALRLLQAGQLHEAQELLVGAGTQLLPPPSKE
jgi:hypothetical protein